MPTDLMRTRCRAHQDLAPNHPARFRRARQLRLHHLVHTKQGCGDPTTTGERYTSHACYLPTRSNEVQELQAQSLQFHCVQHLPMPLPLVQPLQTTALIDVVQQLYRNVSNVRRRACTDASRQRCDLLGEVLQRSPYVLLRGQGHQMRYLFR